MDNKENEQIENILKKSAEAIEMSPFAARWEDIEDRLELDRGDKVIVKEQVPVLAVQSNTTESKEPVDNKKKIWILFIGLFFIILLAIIIPLSLQKTEPVYFGVSDLVHETVNEDKFFDEIQKSGIEIVNIEGYQCEDYNLLKTDRGEVQGGSFVIIDEDNSTVVHIIFYSPLVIVPDNEFIGADKYVIDNTQISYKRMDENTELIEYKALTKYHNVTYELEYLSLSDNVLEFFDGFFS